MAMICSKNSRAIAALNPCQLWRYTVHVSEIGVARDLGFHSFLGKPLDVDKFPEQLKRILNDEPVWVTP